MIWNEKMECASRDEMTAVQSERLIQTVRQIYHTVPGYRAKMQEKGLLPGDIQSAEDLSKLPFTNKSDLRDNYPFGMFTVPMSEIVRLHASSGTTGKPTVVGYTRNDLQMWAEVVTRTLCMAGVHRNDKAVFVIRPTNLEKCLKIIEDHKNELSGNDSSYQV